MPEWNPDLAVEPPSWLVKDARVLHGTFGAGTVGRVGHYIDVPTVWIDFDDRLIQGQTNKSGAVYLYDRKELQTKSMIKKRESFRQEILSTVYDTQ